MIAVYFKRHEVNAVLILLDEAPVSDGVILSGIKSKFEGLLEDKDAKAFYVPFKKKEIGALDAMMNRYITNGYIPDHGFIGLEAKLVELKEDIQNGNMGWDAVKE
jgi:hypothetical protein